jgi:1-acyl-sn-glycerol-3-phosphate acyltransferase
MHAAYFILSKGRALCVFAEGERSFDGKLQRFKKGIGVVANEIDMEIVPVFIDGAFDVWPRTRKRPKPGKIRVVFGKTITSQQAKDEGHKLGIRADDEAIAAGIQKRVGELQ